MASSKFRIRRATVDDLAALKSLWEAMRLPTQALEKRLTEFQVAVDANEHVAGTFGFQIRERHGRIHSEAFDDFTFADEIRPLFWQRLQALATNHGTARLWTCEVSPFWSRNGFQPASGEVLKKLPETWADSSSGWLTLQLKDEESFNSLDKDVAMMMQSERQRTADALQKAKTFKSVVTTIALLLSFICVCAAFYLYFKRNQLIPPPH